MWISLSALIHGRIEYGFLSGINSAMAAKKAALPCTLIRPKVTDHDDGVCRVRGLSESFGQSDILNISTVSVDRIKSLTRTLNKHNCQNIIG